MGDLLQHPGIRTGDSREAERTDRRPGQNNVEILDGNRDLAKLSSFVASYEKYVETFTQLSYFRVKIFNFSFGILPERNRHARARKPDSTSRIGTGWFFLNPRN